MQEQDLKDVKSSTSSIWRDFVCCKGYEVIGDTASLDYLYSLASQNVYCSTTNVRMTFNNNDPSLEPFTVSSQGNLVVLVLLAVNQPTSIYITKKTWMVYAAH
jgi:hypothetical protein